MQHPALRLGFAPGAPDLRPRQLATLQRYVAERTAAPLVANVDAAPNGPVVTCVRNPSLPPEAYAIAGEDADLKLEAADANGLFYGLARLLRDCAFTATSVSPGPWRGTSAPRCPLRGIYFATHFQNFYHMAPLSTVTRYVEELALWGCNALNVWFDMHHYEGLDDPAAQAMVARLHTILAAAEGVGMASAMLFLANEGYANSPAAQRAEWTPQNGYTAEPRGHYHVEICPHKPGGLETLLRTRREMLQRFADIALGYVGIWPYDQGGCTCAACAPWGAGAYPTLAQRLTEEVRALFPHAKTILSTWYFDRFTDGEWAGLTAWLETHDPFFDYIMADTHDGELPRPAQVLCERFDLQLTNFPEISMAGMLPWGAWGANPRPGHWQAYSQSTGPRLAGGFPYSEGIFEDMNKVMALQLYWDPAQDTATILEAYGRAHFGLPSGNHLPDLAGLLETHLPLRLTPTMGGTPWWPGSQTRATAEAFGLVYPEPPAGAAQEAAALTQALAAALPPWAPSGWRWRLVALRARIDAELARGKGGATPALVDALEELTELYCAEETRVAWIRPPAPERMRALLLQGERI